MGVNVTLELDQDALREATAQAILGVLTPELKAKMLEDAIKAILKPSTNTWENKKSPLELAFERAVTQIVNDEAKRLLQEDELLRQKMQELLRTAAKVLGADLDKLTSRMADAFVSSMRKD